MNHRLSFGLRCAPNIFNDLSNFIVLVAKSYGVVNVTNYLDDFIIMAHTQEECLRQRNILIEVMEFLGFKISKNKVTNPSRVATFLGITIDSEKMELSLPPEKLRKLKDALEECLGMRYVHKKRLQKIGGLMSFCSQIVKGGRTYSRRLFDLCAKARPGRAIFLSDATREDIRWWLQFCEVFNCKALIRKNMHHLPMVSDASKRGFGAWCGSDYFYGCWEGYSAGLKHNVHSEPAPEMDNIKVHEGNINVYELWPVLVGLKRWAHLYVNSKVHIITDNMQVLAMVNTGRSKNKLCMSWLRELYWTCFIHNIELHATYIRSEDNILADQLSRLPYKGYLNKCITTLSSNNMCCSLSSKCPGKVETGSE